MISEYKLNTFRKEGDFVIFSYDKIKTNLQYNILPYYKKNIYPDYIIKKELNYFYKNFTGIVVESDLKKHGGMCDFMIKFTSGGTYYYNEDVYLNQCFLVHNENDAKATLYFLMQKAIEELQLSLFQKIKLIFQKDNNE